MLLELLQNKRTLQLQRRATQYLILSIFALVNAAPWEADCVNVSQCHHRRSVTICGTRGASDMPVTASTVYSITNSWPLQIGPSTHDDYSAASPVSHSTERSRQKSCYKPHPAVCCQSPSRQQLLLALTLRGPSGGHCVGLSGRNTPDTLGALWAPSVRRTSIVLGSPFKLHAVAPGGRPEGHYGRSMDDGEKEMKLHAVAPGGPPEGQCKEEPGDGL